MLMRMFTTWMKLGCFTDFVLNANCDDNQEMENAIIEEVDKIILLAEQGLVL